MALVLPESDLPLLRSTLFVHLLPEFLHLLNSSIFESGFRLELGVSQGQLVSVLLLAVPKSGLIGGPLVLHSLQLVLLLVKDLNEFLHIDFLKHLVLGHFLLQLFEPLPFLLFVIHKPKFFCF